MSPRSIGVMKVLWRRSMTVCVTSSPACSAAFTSSAWWPGSTPSRSMAARSEAASRVRSACCSKRSKNCPPLAGSSRAKSPCRGAVAIRGGPLSRRPPLLQRDARVTKPLEFDERVELQTRQRRVRHPRRPVDEVREVALHRERQRVEELVVERDDRAFLVRPADPEVAVREGGDRGLLAEVLVEPRERPVPADLRLAEAGARLPPMRVVGRRFPVVH